MKPRLHQKSHFAVGQLNCMPVRYASEYKEATNPTSGSAYCDYVALSVNTQLKLFDYVAGLTKALPSGCSD